MTSQDVRESDSGRSFLSTRQRDGLSLTEVAAVGSVEKDVGGQRHHAFMVCHVRVWTGTPQFNWFCAAMRLYNS